MESTTPCKWSGSTPCAEHDEGWFGQLFVFTCVDRGEWQGETVDPTRWFNIRELYSKAMARFGKGVDIARSLERAGYAPEELAILKDFGADFFEGRYRTYANRFGSHLVRLTETGGEEVGPKVSVVRDGTSIILGVASRDFRGLAACICGALAGACSDAPGALVLRHEPGPGLGFFSRGTGRSPTWFGCHGADRGGDSRTAPYFGLGRRACRRWRRGQPADGRPDCTGFVVTRRPGMPGWCIR